MNAVTNTFIAQQCDQSGEVVMLRVEPVKPRLLWGQPAESDLPNPAVWGEVPGWGQDMHPLFTVQQLKDYAQLKSQEAIAQPERPATLTAWVLFRKDEDGLEPVMFYGGPEKPTVEFKERFELRPVWVDSDIAQPVPPTPLKGHEIAQAVNALRDVAMEYYGSKQLRERIAHIVVPLLQAAQQVQPADATLMDEGTKALRIERAELTEILLSLVAKDEDGLWTTVFDADTRLPKAFDDLLTTLVGRA